MELTPQPPAAEASRSPRQRRRPLAYVVLLVAAVGLGVVVWQSLSSAALYFYNADEAVARRAELGDRQFRLQGLVEEGSVRTVDDAVDFVVTFNDVDVPVHHEGDPPELFEPGIPVVVEGRWSQGEGFEGDRILVRHGEDYEADHGDRLTDAEDGRGDQAPDAGS